jgi:murein DD-endopeptidase MepM/ murein hydrolase activator NlpD
MNDHRIVPGHAHLPASAAPRWVRMSGNAALPASLLGAAIMGLVFALGPGPQIIISAAGDGAAAVPEPSPGDGVSRSVVARLAAPVKFIRVSIATIAKPEREPEETATTVPQAVERPQPASASAPGPVPRPFPVPQPVPAPLPAAMAPATVAKGGPPASRAWAFASPLPELTLTSRFGYRVNPLTGAPNELHTGQDFGASCGTAVAATAEGTVSFAGWDGGGGGNRLVIDHGAGIQTTYNHLSAITVKEGQRIERGEVAARVGTTGSSTGCHLHFEVLLRGVPVDPAPWL